MPTGTHEVMHGLIRNFNANITELGLEECNKCELPTIQSRLLGLPYDLLPSLQWMKTFSACS